MSGSLPYNALMPVAARSDAAGAAPPGPLTVPGPDGWSFTANRIPNYNPPGTHTGAIPTPDPASGQLQFPSGQAFETYSHAMQLLQQQGVPPALINQLLQIVYQRGRT